jgi:aspartate/methionine/tyrosine aminotransferase
MTESCLEAGLARAREQGIPIRALLVTSPNNPLGTVLSADEVRTAIEFARRHRIEVAFDEIYAHSIFSGRPFESALRWREAYPDYRDHVHFIYGMSKDFTLGGLRIGIYHNPSPEVLRVMASLAYFSTIPADTQRMLAGVLADAAWVDAFLAENRRRLGAALACWNTELQSHTGAGAFPAEAGVFAWLDLRPWLDEPTFAAEQRLYEKMITTARVSVLPGEVFHSAEPGWFRSCFAQSHSTLREAAERLAKALKK